MTDSPILTTEIFRLSPTDYFKQAASGSLAIVWWILLPVTLVALIASAWDLRFALVGLIILLLIVPMYVVHIYFSKLLNVDAASALSTKSIAIYPDGHITTHYYIIDADGTPQLSKVSDISKSQIKSIIFGSTKMVINIQSSSAPLIIPYSVVKETEIVEKICRLYGEEIAQMS